MSCQQNKDGKMNQKKKSFRKNESYKTSSVWVRQTNFN